MSCAVLKVEFEKELRRVSVDSSISFGNLKQKLASMFSLDDTGFVVSLKNNDSVVRIDSDEECKSALHTAAQRKSVLRLLIEKAKLAVTKEESAELCSNCAGVLRNALYYKCLNCLSYELCESCAANGCHADHMLVMLRKPLDSLSPQQQLVFLKHIIDPAEQVAAKQRRQELREKAETTQASSPTVADVPSADAPAINVPERNMNVSLLMSEFQEVVTEAATRPVEPSIEKEMATWDKAVIVSDPEPKQEEKPVEPVVPAPVIEQEEKPNPFKANLEALEQMGFCDREKNIRLLVKHVNDLEAAVEELLHSRSWFFPEAFARFGL